MHFLSIYCFLIVNTIGSVDDLIEKLQSKCKVLENLSLHLFNKFESKEYINFSEVFICINGGTFKSKDYVPYSNYKLITIKNVDDNGFNTSSISYLNESFIDKRYQLKIGDILLTMTGNIGRVGIVDEENCYLNQRVLKVICKSKLYLYAYLIKYKGIIITLGKGTAQLNLSLEDLNKLIINNSLEEINKFSKYDYIFDYLVNIKLQIKKLKEIKSKLLEKYF